MAFGVNRQSLGAYIMRSEAERETWGESAELLGTHNYTSYTVKKDGTGASGTWGINISGNAASATNAGYATTAGSAPAHSYIVIQGDTRDVATKPDDYGNRITFVGLKNNNILSFPFFNFSVNFFWNAIMIKP